MQAFVITGGQPLLGSVRIGGAKNASFKLMIASLLADSESRLLNFSRISDVEQVANIIVGLGGKVNRAGERAMFIDPSTLVKSEIDATLGEQGRFSSMFIPALVARHGRATVPAPGGDKIGKRPLERHLEGLQQLGINVTWRHGMLHAESQGLRGAKYRFAKNTHTGTETLIMAAVKARGQTILENAALEPEIDDLIRFLNACGAQIERRANRVILIEGVPHLHGSIHKIMPDRNEAVTYACLALATKGDVIIENARAAHLTAFLAALEKVGAGFESGPFGMRFFYRQPLVATAITTEVEPGFMTDWQPLWATLMTQAKGTSTIHETIMPSRFQYVADLNQMGGQLSTYQPDVSNPEEVYNFNLADDAPGTDHALKISGPTTLKASNFQVKDLRHGATLVSASLVASGQSIIRGIEQIDRGYEDLDNRLRSMGALIERQEVS